MFRFVALIWESINHRHITIAESLSERFQYSQSAWREAVNYSGLRVFVADVQHGALEPQLLAGHAGVVLGSVFKTNASSHDESASRRVAFDEATTDAIRASRGQWLIRNAWGNYVAIWGDPRTSTTLVLKDPTGNLPVFSTTHEGVTVVFSSIVDCLDLGLRAFTVNRRALELRVYGGDMTHELEPLNEVTQIRRGECVEFDPRTQPSIVGRRFYWNPFRLERMHELIEDEAVGAQALLNTLRSCTRTLARPHESALLRLSGGLDSSIILGCLTDMPTPPRLLSYTQYTSDAGSDPRPWARAALEYRPCEHSELALAASGINLKAMLGMAPSVEPFSTLMHLTIGDHEQELAASRQATAIFSGDGGDSAFGSFCVGEVVHAYLRRHGPQPAVFRLAAQSAAVLQ
ncbi:MAG: asparagine synthase-related protein [Steroidobacteraceae bacterium]